MNYNRKPQVPPTVKEFNDFITEEYFVEDVESWVKYQEPGSVTVYYGKIVSNGLMYAQYKEHNGAIRKLDGLGQEFQVTPDQVVPVTAGEIESIKAEAESKGGYNPGNPLPNDYNNYTGD